MGEVLTFIKKLLERFWTSKFMVLNLLIAVLFFVIFPGLIFYRGAAAISERQLKRLQVEEKRDMEARLNELEYFAGEGRFPHFLLSALCRRPDGQKINLNDFRKRLGLLQNSYPQAFVFVVADEDGRVIEALSDVKGYRYLYRQFFELINDLSQVSSVSSVKNIDARLRRLRPLIGNLLREEDLLLPLQSIRNGRSIMVSGAQRNHHLWYGKGQDFSVAASISRDFIKSDAGLRWATGYINLVRPDLVTGFVRYPPDSESVFPQLSEESSAFAVRAVAEHELVQHKSADNSLKKNVVCSFLSQQLRGFCFRKDAASKNENSVLVSYHVRALAFLLLFFLLMGVHHLRHPVRLTIKLKLFVLFAYAIILPLLVIGTISGEYISQTESRIINEMQKKVFRELENLEDEYAWYQQDLNDRLNILFSGKHHFFRERKNDGARLAAFEKELRQKFGYDQIFLWDSTGRDLMAGLSPRVFSNSSLLRRIGLETLEIVLADPMRLREDQFEWSAFNFSIDRLDRDGKTIKRGVGDLDFMMFSKALADRQRNFSDSFSMTIFWSEQNFQERFMRLYTGSPGYTDAGLLVMNREVDRLLFSRPDCGFDDTTLLSQIKDGLGRGSFRISCGADDFIAFQGISRALNLVRCIYLFPVETVESEIAEIYRVSLLLLCIMVILAFWSIYLLGSWISRPIGELLAGVRAIGERRFNHRLEVTGENEFGQLICAFNSSIETLQDLEIAKIVQDSLMPVRKLKTGQFEILGDTSVMTRLCGDYFDLVKIDEDRTLVFVGDATGHGIPAALTMAMVKTVLINESIEGLEQTKVMERLNHLFKHLRKDGAKECMTSISALLDDENSVVQLINCGHCYPVIYKYKTGTTHLLENIRGLPPGFGRNVKIVPASVELETGDILFLYTDGLIECCNDKEEILGFEGWQKILEKCCSEDLATYCARIRSAIRMWEKIPADDQTFVMVRRL